MLGRSGRLVAQRGSWNLVVWERSMSQTVQDCSEKVFSSGAEHYLDSKVQFRGVLLDKSEGDQYIDPLVLPRISARTSNGKGFGRPSVL